MKDSCTLRPMTFKSSNDIMLLNETNPVVCTQKMSTHLIYPKFKWMRIGFKLLDILIHRFSIFLKVGNEKGITLLKAHVC